MQTIWLMNHYATGQYLERTGRHYWLARKLVERGHQVEVFAASTLHGPSEVRQVRGTRSLDGVQYTFLRTPRYRTRVQRAVNAVVYFLQLLRAGLFSRTRPDVIYASSVHPLTLLAGILLARRYRVPAICEVRDLWPLSIEVYEPGLRGSQFTSILYRLEHWLYRHADQLIFTMEGGGQYIRDRGWEDSVSLEKVHHINNGIDLRTFDELSAGSAPKDRDLEDPELFTVVYTGSVRQVNKVDVLVEVARELERRGERGIRILVYGGGDKLAELERAASEVPMIAFRGRVPSREIPQVLVRSDALIMHGDQGLIAQYGSSMNKLFEYLASGRPILSDCQFGFDPIIRERCGIVVPAGTPADLADSIVTLRAMSDGERDAMGARARRTAEGYDFEILTDRLEDIIRTALAQSSTGTVVPRLPVA